MNRPARLVIGSLLVLAALPSLGLAAEPAQLLQQLQSSFTKERVDAAKTLEREALAAPEIYAYIASRLQSEPAIPSGNRDRADEVAWLCKALAASGDSGYRETLLRVAEAVDNSAVSRHCKGAADNVERYAERQRILNQTEGIPGLEPELNRYAKMMQSDDPRMIADGAKLLLRNPSHDERIYDVARDVLLTGFTQKRTNPQHVDAMAWLCKCLGSSEKAKYRPALERVATEAGDWKLANFAKQAAANLP